MGEHLLDCRQVARFVADGFLDFPGLVPEEINRAVLDELGSGALSGVRWNNGRQPLGGFLADAPGYRRVIDLPAIRGIVASLVGPDPLVDHRAVHVVQPGQMHGGWHADATIDARTAAFDLQIFYFPHDTPRAAGGTMFLPGSHLRLVHESCINRYQHIRGQLPTVCPAGTILVAHHGLWHSARPNHTGRTRSMIKLRLDPTVRQERLFDLSDLDHPDIPAILTTHHRWLGVEHRLEFLQRLRLWRTLTGSDYDHDLWLTRLESPAATLAPVA
jgi:hypothetical protein